MSKVLPKLEDDDDTDIGIEVMVPDSTGYSMILYPNATDFNVDELRLVIVQDRRVVGIHSPGHWSYVARSEATE